MNRRGRFQTPVAAEAALAIANRWNSIQQETLDLTIDTLVRVGMALGGELHQTFVPAGRQVRWIIESPASEFETSMTSHVAEESTTYRVKKSK